MNIKSIDFVNKKQAELPKGITPRALGTNPRALGTNPRALGTNPRVISPKQLKAQIEPVKKVRPRTYSKRYLENWANRLLEQSKNPIGPKKPDRLSIPKKARLPGGKKQKEQVIKGLKPLNPPSVKRWKEAVYVAPEAYRLDLTGLITPLIREQKQR